VSEALAQLSAWRQLFGPFIEKEIRFLDSARPEPVDENAISIIVACRLVSSLCFDHGFLGDFKSHAICILRILMEKQRLNFKCTAPDWLWASFVSALLLLISGGIGLLVGQPWLFPSLGPSALLHAYHPSNPAARLYNTVLGHVLGIAAGYLSVFVFHASAVPAVLSTEELTPQRLGASVFAMFLTVASQIPLKAFHPPAAATALLITLGAFKLGLKELEVLVIGVMVVAFVGEFFRRIRLNCRRE
jgi:hypothetical protein